MKNVALITRRSYQCRTTRKTWIWATVMAALVTVLIAGCQKLQYEHCTSKGEPSEFWSKYDLPTVDGAELCSEYKGEKGRAITFIHYHDKEHSYADYSEPYEHGFTETGWKTAKVVSSKSAWGMYLARQGDALYVSFADCYAGQDVSLQGACAAVSIRETNEIPQLK